jgi:hypothetical protein
MAARRRGGLGDLCAETRQLSLKVNRWNLRQSAKAAQKSLWPFSSCYWHCSRHKNPGAVSRPGTLREFQFRE